MNDAQLSPFFGGDLSDQARLGRITRKQQGTEITSFFAEDLGARKFVTVCDS